MQLSKSEEQLMELIWKHEKVFMKDLLENHPIPVPATTTIATLLKRMQDKGYVGYELYGNSRRYHALIEKDDHFNKQLKGMVKDFFSNSALQFASFFTTSGNLTAKELEELKEIIDQQIRKSKK